MGNVIEKLERLIDAMTEAATEVKVYYGRQNGTELPLVTSEDATAATTSAKRARKPKEEKTALPPLSTNGEVEVIEKKMSVKNGSSAPAEMTEEESTQQTWDIAKAFVQRYQNAKPDGRERALEILKKEFSVSKLPDLVHSQRIQFISRIKQEMEKTAVAA